MIAENLTYQDLPEFYGLREIERRFVCEYVADPKRNGTDAAIRAGYKNGTGKASAAVAASRLLRKDKIVNAVKALEAKVGGSDSLPRMIATLDAIIYTDVSDVVRWDEKGNVSMVPSRDLSPAASAALASIQDTQEEIQPRLPGIGDESDVAVKTIRRNIKFHDKLRALEIKAKIMGCFAPERRDVGVTGQISHTHEVSPAVAAALNDLLGGGADEQSR